jgi:hypothetical protein
VVRPVPPGSLACLPAITSGTVPKFGVGFGRVSLALRFMSLAGNCKFKYFAAQMTTHKAARILEIDGKVTLV